MKKVAVVTGASRGLLVSAAWSRFSRNTGAFIVRMPPTAPTIRVAPDSKNFRVLSRVHSEFYRVLLDARATNSSSFESKSFRTGDWFDFL